MRKVESLVEQILELDEDERREWVETMKNEIEKWKKRCESELKWMEFLEMLGFKK